MKSQIIKIYWLLTRIWLCLHGVKLGRNVRCNGFPSVKIGKSGQFVIGDNVQINASPWANAHVISGATNFFVGKGAILKIKNDAGISGARIVAMRQITIGQGVFIGGGCLICDSDMHEIPLGSENPVQHAPITINDRAFIGAGSIIIKGVEVGEGAVIGAGSTVSKSIPSHTLVAGNPAKFIRRLI